ncbi:class I SAM-dependent methyltransferase [Caulobacter sp. S45]|uniref:class I SAM-dependent methyltransferase n=1 Tax=Caulobacter sp. S45 TaxID=1641861 RepID=UPI0015750A21|nr:class I SAM-dependent methyltransferase [Caulobacter sp. S45]
MRAVLLAAVALMSAGRAAFAQPAAPAGGRPPADVAADVHRHPDQVIAFAGVKPGDTVIEMIPGGGYYTRLLSAAVGPGGRVFAVVPNVMAEMKPETVTSERALAAEPGYGNVTVVVEGLGKITDQGPADVVWTTQNYHDLHNNHVPPDTAAAVDKAVFAALKPGGVYLVEDHVAAAGAGASQASTLHRIEPAFARAEITQSGLRFEATSSTVANPADPHTAAVFDPSIRGRTDQFIFRFRKPAA